jgi:hypothetical protein
MFSCPTTWSPGLAPERFHIIHAYTLESFDRWPALAKDNAAYKAAKEAAAVPLFAAIRSVIPDLDTRLQHPDAICMLGYATIHSAAARHREGSQVGRPVGSDGCALLPQVSADACPVLQEAPRLVRPRHPGGRGGVSVAEDPDRKLVSNRGQLLSWHRGARGRGERYGRVMPRATSQPVSAHDGEP